MNNINGCFSIRIGAATIKTIAAVLLIGLMPGIATAQYLGADQCTGCHDAQYEDWMTSGHRFILMNGENASNRPLPLPQGEKWDDISYVVGGAKTKALYLDDQGYIMQEQFNLLTGEWSDAHSGGLVPYDCAACHSTGYQEAGNQGGLPGFVGTFALPGVQCEHCHGAGLAMNPGNTDPAFCGTCHNHGPEETVLAGDGFIKSEGQYNEYMASPHSSDGGPSCVDCHSPHKRVEFGVKTECETCHNSQATQYAGTLMDKVGVGCTDCHMAQATLSAQPLGPNKGDMKSHIFNINTDPAASMFTPDGSALVLEDGEGAVTLDFVCQACHTGASLETLAKFAKDFHDADKTLADYGLNPGLSGTWWGGESRSGEGFLIEFAYAGPTLYFFGSFYTYDNAGNLVWLTFQPTTGVPETGTTMSVDVFITEGAQWGADFDPADVTRAQFGNGTFTFDTCTTGNVAILVNQEFQNAGFSNLAYDLSRVFTPGINCPSFDNNSEAAVAAQ